MEKMAYTIKSESEDGVYYLVNGWEKHKTFWIAKEDIAEKPEKLCKVIFKTAANAKASLTKLLKIMPDYMDDVFTVISFNTDLSENLVEKITK